eukprot:483921-Prymnesium_polylepis.2
MSLSTMLSAATIASAALQLDGAWQLTSSTNGGAALLASRAGRTPLALTSVALELGTTSGGKTPWWPQGCGFTAVLGTWNAQVRAELKDPVLERTSSAGAALSGTL